MTKKEFNIVLEERIKSIRGTLSSKGKEYASEEDRLHNFKLASEINRETPQESLWGMATKHLVSVIDLVKGRLEPTEKNINAKIGDMINYLILLEALFKERK